MKRFVAGLTPVVVAFCAFGLAPAVADEHPDHPADRPAERAAPQQRTEPRDRQPAPRPPEHQTTVVHRTVVEHRTVINEHINENVRVVRPTGFARWHRGERFAGNRVVFNEWGRYHLRPPPPGYAWVRDGDGLVLISLGTGVIDDYFVLAVP